MTLLNRVVPQVDDLTTIGDSYDQIVNLAGGRRTFDPTGNNLELKYQASTETQTLSTHPITPGTTVTTN